MPRRRPRPPQEPAPTPPVPFVLLPVPQIPGAAPPSLQQILYQIALQQAQEQAGNVHSGLVERDWLGTWN